MDICFSRRAESFQPNIFNILNERKNRRLAEGKDVYNLSIGTPDFPVERHIMEAVSQAALDPENYKYAISDSPELIEAVQGWYRRRYGVELDGDEIMSVYGSQEGIAHIGLVFCNPGDVVLVPNPCYPIFQIGPYLNDAKVEFYALDEKNDYLPDLDAIPEETARRAKLMIVSFPANPVCAVAPRAFYEKLIRFAEKYNIFILHDNAYSDILYDGREGISFLSLPGAKEVGAEFNSLSKTYNLTGLRISFLLGNRRALERFRTLRSQIDYGICHLVQKAAIAALNGPQQSVEANRLEYERRRDALCGGLRSIGWDGAQSRGTMFVWAPVPAGFATSEEFCLELLDKTGVICTPGSSFASLGEGHVRFALVLPVEKIQRLVQVVDQSGILKR